ncbi:DNA-directed RNA polymerase subunit beta' [Patescibacteria group bacterium]
MPDTLNENHPLTINDFNAIRLSILSPDEILKRSHGEVTRPETINYRTQRPERDGLFCEKIFGPTKDWECYCGKYKRIRYKGVVCDRCGVEVTRSIVRRKRIGHIKLATPVTHIWFLGGTSSKLSLLLDISTKDIEKVVYFAGYIIKEVNEEAKKNALKQLEGEVKNRKNELSLALKKILSEVNAKKQKELSTADAKNKSSIQKKYQGEITKKREEIGKEIEKLDNAKEIAKKELSELKNARILSEIEYRNLSMKYGQVFTAGMGAETIREIVEKFDLDQLVKKLENQLRTQRGQKRQRVAKRLQLIKGLKESGMRPEWMLTTVIPIIPPDLRPMVQLDGGRFAASDLNDLYRRVINRNNRLKRLIELGAPEVICRNEKRMLQEAVDALIDNNARRGNRVTSSTGQKRVLKSLADVLRGKQGRFRQNLLGKRVDYSARSVIVVGPDLRLDQCGIPKEMAMELFKPYVIGRLIKEGYTHNIKGAGKIIEQRQPEAWDMLEKAIENRYVLLNRAPTLHRLGIQAFKPVLIEGKAIQIHPLICAAYNADFDGDQMAVHLPLSKNAQREAKEIMQAANNILKPSAGEAIIVPSLEIVLGCYHITRIRENSKGEGKCFSDMNEAILAYRSGIITLQTKIKVKIRNKKYGDDNNKVLETSVGRLIFNSFLPSGMNFQNKTMDQKELKKLVKECFYKYNAGTNSKLLDQLKRIGFKFATKSGISLGIGDIKVPKIKKQVIEDTKKKVHTIEEQYKEGLITDEERYNTTISIWTQAKNEITDKMMEELDKFGPIYSMSESGARGNIEQITQLGGMKGLVTNPAGKIIELPIRSNLKEGLEVLEYFISTHGARKGKTDTALRTADAGYLTRRLVDVTQDINVTEKDCGTKEGIKMTKKESEKIGEPLSERILGRIATATVKNPKNDQIIVKRGEMIDKEKADLIDKLNVENILVRSPITCSSIRGICQKCYGYDLATRKLVEIDEVVGVVAAQAIGEPGTQLTLRTFHTGGVAGKGKDITQGLPRVEELFEVRTPRNKAPIAEIDGSIEVEKDETQYKITLISEDIIKDHYKIKKGFKVNVKNNSHVEKRGIIAEKENVKPIRIRAEGNIQIKGDKATITRDRGNEYIYNVPLNTKIFVKNGEKVKAGTALTEGHMDPKEIFKISGPRITQKYIIQQVQKIYASQGQMINDKHIEVITRQMFSRVKVKDSGGTNLLSGDIVKRSLFRAANKKAMKENKTLATAQQLILGITKASLNTHSWLAAASFQETTRVLIEAAIKGKIDGLEGLKENIVIGKLIPAGTAKDKTYTPPHLTKPSSFNREPRPRADTRERT